jgi:hypothetical protein
LADHPQQTIRELRELVVAYAKQETVDPLKGLGRYAGFGIAGGVLFGVGYMFIAVGSLRLLQGWGDSPDDLHFQGNWSWVPYAIVVAGSAIIAGLIWMARGKRASKATAKAGGAPASTGPRRGNP